MILISMHEWCGKNGNLGAWPMAPFRWLGRNSYEIYLTHSFIIILLASFLFNAKQSTSIIIILYAITIILSGILGQLISTYFSEPLNRFIRSKTGSPTKTHTIAVLSPWR
jgi:peptidoglycan/LPS O-acetylase OafA/YrhL